MKKIINKLRGKYQFILDREGQELEVVGRFYLTGDQVGRWDIEIIHAAPNTSSKTNIKGVVDGAARAFVNGIIKVLPVATGTEAFGRKDIISIGTRQSRSYSKLRNRNGRSSLFSCRYSRED